MVFDVVVRPIGAIAPSVLIFVPLAEYSHPVLNSYELITSVTFVFVVVVLERTPWLKFGTTGTAAAGLLSSKSNNNLT